MTGHRNGGAAVVQTLAAHGVDTIFGIPGTHNLEIYRHLPTTGIRAVTPRHEQGAGYAAEAFARVTGRADQRDDRGVDGVRGIAADAGAVVGPADRC
jgi:glyoxylate carboligase